MVKETPKQQDRLTRRRRKYIKLQDKELHSLLHGLKMATSPTPTQHLLQHATKPTFKTPPPLSKKRPCSCSSSSTSRSYSPSTYGTCSSSSPPLSPSTLSSPSFLHSVSSPATTARTQQSQSLRRTVSDPPVFSSDSISNSKMREIIQELAAMPSPPVSRNLMSQLLPPLPPSPSPKLLRRTVSEPVTPSSDGKTFTAKETEKVKMQEQMVKAEKLSGDWTMIKLNCGCGSDFKFLFCGTDSKCYKLV